MLPNRKIWTWFEGAWHEGNVMIMGAADHGTWLGTMVFDGARAFEGVTPDLDLHCARANHSAVAMGLRPTMATGEMVELAMEGVSKFTSDAALYIRPMYWSREGDDTAVLGNPESTAFALCLEEASMGPPTGFSVTTTRYTRPTLATNLTNCKASCLYPNNARMLREAHAKGFQNAIVCDALGNVAETATSNIFMVKNGEVFTPVPNGTFLNGVTRQRVVRLLRDAGYTVHETTLTLDDFRAADEMFSTGNYSKVVPIVKFDGHEPGPGPITMKARELYWDWAHA
ncbi:MAG: branched-chain amino acid aminotransferase [Pseudomonadota bacterium]|nr:branched-chain amino acid aminotransferase [Pseudomonadota bacterium]